MLCGKNRPSRSQVVSKKPDPLCHRLVMFPKRVRLEPPLAVTLGHPKTCPRKAKGRGTARRKPSVEGILGITL